MADTKPGYGPSRALNNYWVNGAGAAKWVGSPHPFTALVSALRRAGVPERSVHGYAAELFHARFGIYPGQRERSKRT